MKAPNAFWIGIICALGGCTQLLELDKDYREGQTSSSSGEAGAGGNGGSAGMGGTGGAGQCNQPSDCTMLPPDDECQTRTCDNHVCGQTFTASGTSLTMQTIRDCQEAFCDGAGMMMMQTNDMDLPEDNNPCTKNVCSNGVPSFPPEPINTNCGGTLKCDGTGQCIGCTVPNDCAGMDDFCKTRTCTNGTCGFNFTAMGTDLVTGQVANDCRSLECDGQGNAINNPEDTDIPVDDNPCTKDVCIAGVSSNPFEPFNTPCGTSSICNGSGVCKKLLGQMCMVAGECSSGYCIEGYCCDSACGQSCKACNVPGSVGTCTIVPAGYTDDSCASPKSCDGTQGGNNCTSKFPMGYPCTLGTQCGGGICADGVCCNTSCLTTCQACNVAGSVGSCTNVPSGQEDLVATTMCTGVNSCNGNGACLLDNGQPCLLNAECVSNNCAGVPAVCSP